MVPSTVAASVRKQSVFPPKLIFPVTVDPAESNTQSIDVVPVIDPVIVTPGPMTKHLGTVSGTETSPWFAVMKRQEGFSKSHPLH